MSLTASPRPPVVDRADAPARGGRATAAGLLSGAGALVVGEAVGRLVPGAASPVVAVGNAVVALAPPSARDTGIAVFGTLDKPLLVAGILIVVLALAATAGRLHTRAPAAAGALVLTLAVAAGAAVVRDATTTAAGGAVVAVAVFATGVLLLRFLLTAEAGATDGAARRAFLRRGLGLGVLLVAGGSVVRLLDMRGQVAAARSALRLTPVARRAPGDLAAAAFDVPGLTPVVTSNARFYRIDTALVVPQVDPTTWALRVDGMVDRPLRLTLEDLLALPQTEADITLQCVSNEVGGDLVGLARWQGVRLRDLLEMAGARPGADQVVGVSVDGWTAGFPTQYATDDRLALVALGMNGELLPIEHGFPARLVVPGLYGYVSATKWLKSVTLTTWDGFDGFWVPRGWSKLGPIKVASRIDVPADTSVVRAGPVTVAGMAWAPGRLRGVTAVHIRVDRTGPWLEAELAGALSEDAWRQWRLVWDAAPGEHLLEVRATDRTGEVQDERRAPPRPDGATGFHAVRVLAR